MDVRNGPGKKRRGPTEAEQRERLARLVLKAYCGAKVEVDPHHVAPEWEEMRTTYRGVAFRAVARELWDMGVRPPLAEE